MALNDWTPLILGGGGLFTVMSFVTKGLVDQKQETINRYDQQCKDLKEEIKAEREKAKEMLKSISEVLREIELRNLDPVNAALLSNAMLKAEEPLKSLDQDFTDCEIAANWVNLCKAEWAKEASSYGARKYPKLVPLSKRSKFKTEIERYLDWVHIYLYKGAVGDADILLYVKKPSVSSPHPYAASIRYLLDKGEWGELTIRQAAFLKEVLIRLIERINDSPLLRKDSRI